MSTIGYVVQSWISPTAALVLVLLGLIACCREPRDFSVWKRLRDILRHPWYVQALLVVVIVKLIAYGSTKTNQTGNAGGDVTNPPPASMGFAFPGVGSSWQTVTDSDISNGYQLISVTTDDFVQYAMPQNAEYAGKWHLRGAFEDVVRIDFGDWRFLIGTNLVDHLWAFTWGMVRPEIRDETRQITAVGAPMSAVPTVSKLWTSVTGEGSRLITWERFVAGRLSVASNAVDAVMLDAQIELFANGDFITRSNEVVKAYRRVDPDDWDGDGWHNEDDESPYERAETYVGLSQYLPDGANTNAYCWVDVRCDYNSHVWFDGDGYSDMCDPWFTAGAGEVHRVMLLIGKTYYVDSERPLTVVARSNPAIVVDDNGTCSPTICWPVEFTVADGTAPVHPGLLGATWNQGGRAFYVLPTPSFLGGTISWPDDTCCAVWGDGTNFTFQCDNTCTCDGCTVYGYYGYEGYSLPVGGVSCGCSFVEDDGPAEIVEFGFTKSAVIYEDPYTNMPGVVVTPAPSNSVLRCVVRGGTYGGRLTITLNGAGESKISRVAGNALPKNVEISPGIERTFEIEYTPVAPSDGENDIVATATFVENFLNVTSTETASLTSIKLQLEAVYVAPENHNQSRHVYGVGEHVNFIAVPSASGVMLHVNKVDCYDQTTFYDTFAGESLTSAVSVCQYRCPAVGTIPDVWLSYMESQYQPAMSVIEPQFVVTPEASARGAFFPGEVAMGDLRTVNYIGPMTVSFQGVQVFEVPCENLIPPTGYFATTNYTGPRVHNEDAGAGVANTIRTNNHWTVDEAGRNVPYPNWSGGSMIWLVPVGWRRILPGGENAWVARDYDYEFYGQKQSRPLLIGGDEAVYRQVFTIETNGTSSVEKFGYRLTRTRWSIWGSVVDLSE